MEPVTRRDAVIPLIAGAPVEGRTDFAVANFEVLITAVEVAVIVNPDSKAVVELEVSAVVHSKTAFAGNWCFGAATAKVD